MKLFLFISFALSTLTPAISQDRIKVLQWLEDYFTNQKKYHLETLPETTDPGSAKLLFSYKINSSRHELQILVERDYSRFSTGKKENSAPSYLLRLEDINKWYYYGNEYNPLIVFEIFPDRKIKATIISPYYSEFSTFQGKKITIMLNQTYDYPKELDKYLDKLVQYNKGKK